MRLCQVPGCRNVDVEVVYYGKRVCKSCWLKHSVRPFLKEAFRIRTEAQVLRITGTLRDFK